MLRNILFYSVFLILISLGFWQSFRWYYKDQLINKIKAQEGLHAIAINDIDDIESYKYRKVTLKGRFLNDKSIYYYSLRNNIPGYEIITPFQVSDSLSILVNRGWSKKKILSKKYYKGIIIISGNFVELPRKYLITSKNDLNKNTWFDLKPEVIASYMNIETKPFMLLLNTNKYLLGKKIKFSSKSVINNHMSYTITWFVFAIVLVIFYFTSSRKKHIQLSK